MFFRKNVAEKRYRCLEALLKPQLGTCTSLVEPSLRLNGQWLKTFFALHPTFWLKVVEGVSSIFASKSKVVDNVVYMDKLLDLHNLLGADQLKIPEEILNTTIKLMQIEHCE